MKNLNVKLAKNFKVNTVANFVGFKIKTSNEKKEQIVLFTEKFLEGLIKQDIFPEENDSFEITLPSGIYGDQEVDLRISPKKITYYFNKKFELQYFYIRLGFY